MRSPRFLPAALLAVFVSAGLGGVFGGNLAATQDDRAPYRVYTEAIAAIQREYVEAVPSEQLVYSSIDGLLNTLDPHSNFFKPRDYAQMRERQQGSYYGLGVTIASIDGDITIQTIFEGSPAYKRGIRRGDIIAKVGTEDAKGWSTEEVVKRVKGPKGTTVDITIRRPGLETLIPLTVERDEIKIVTVRAAFMIAPGTGYIRLQDFSETSDSEVGEALNKLRANNLERVILDLRDNPGGPLDQAIAVANRFLSRGQMIVYTRGRLPNSNEEYRAANQGDTTTPLVVLVNRGTASASEIVSGSMQDHDRGIVVGETTFGKALVQSVYPIANGAGLALTTGRYYTPAGRMIQRPWDSSFDDYLTYGLRDQDSNKSHTGAQMKTTDVGRKVYGGGGIEPDHFIAGPVEGFNPTRFSRLLNQRGAFVGFAERFTKEGEQRPGAQSAAAHKVAPGWQVTDAMVDEFRRYVVDQRVKMDDAAFKTDLPFIKAMIHYEVDVDLFSVEEARKNLTRVDPQLQSALGYFTEAKQLLAMKKAN